MNHLLTFATITASFCLGSAAMSQEAAAPLALSCQAAGDVVSKSETYDWTKRPDGSYGYDLKSHQNVLRKEIRYELIVGPDGGKLRMPEEKPGFLGKKPEGGWYPIERLQLREDVIEGRVNFGFMDAPSIRIDRRTGAFAIGDFKGDCERIPAERKF